MSSLVAAATRFAERIRVNEVSREHRAGRDLWIKRRRPAAPPILAAANLFFRLTSAPLRAIENARRWQRWEVSCFRGLHGASFDAWAEGSCTVVAEAIPGISLARELDAARLTTAQAAAAGRELRRAHQWPGAELRTAWSHGDPHTGNFLYEADEDRARLIDFEVIHDRTLPPAGRHADDLLVFLQDVLGKIATERWLPVASAFLDGYDREEIIARLRPLLVLPRGLPRLWWAIRTGALPTAEITRRLATLRAALAERSLLATS